MCLLVMVSNICQIGKNTLFYFECQVSGIFCPQCRMSDKVFRQFWASEQPLSWALTFIDPSSRSLRFFPNWSWQTVAQSSWLDWKPLFWKDTLHWILRMDHLARGIFILHHWNVCCVEVKEPNRPWSLSCQKCLDYIHISEWKIGVISKE